MNRVTGCLAAESAINESREKLSHTSDCLEAPFCLVKKSLNIPFSLAFQ